MQSRLAAESAILVHLETIGVVLLVLHSVVVSLLALRACHSDLHAHYLFTSVFAGFYFRNLKSGIFSPPI